MTSHSYFAGTAPSIEALQAIVEEKRERSALAKKFGLEFIDHDWVDFVCADKSVEPARILASFPKDRFKLWDPPLLKKALVRIPKKPIRALIHIGDPIEPGKVPLRMPVAFRKGLELMFLGPYADGGFEPVRPRPKPALTAFARYRALARDLLGQDDDDGMLLVASVHLALQVEKAEALLPALLSGDTHGWKTDLKTNDVITFILKNDAKAWKLRQSPSGPWNRILDELKKNDGA